MREDKAVGLAAEADGNAGLLLLGRGVEADKITVIRAGNRGEGGEECELRSTRHVETD